MALLQPSKGGRYFSTWAIDEFSFHTSRCFWSQRICSTEPPKMTRSMIPPNIPQVSLTAIRSAAFSFIALAMILITASTSRAMDMVDMLAMGVTWDIEAVADGDWDDGATWSGGQTPQTGDNVLIPSGFTVTLTHQDTAVLDRILVQGTLSIQNGNTRLTVDTLLVDNSPRGALHIGSPSSGIGHDKLAEIIIAASATVPLTGGEMGRGVISQGEVRMYSDTRDTKGFLQGDALAGATQLTMASAPSGWQVGDMIVEELRQTVGA